MSIKNIKKWIETPNDYYKTYLLIETFNNSTYYILSDEDKAIVYRGGFLEVGGFYKVYKYYKNMWIITCEGFGSPTNKVLYIDSINNICKVSTNYNIYNFDTENNIFID